jgi:hypothetical protein
MMANAVGLAMKITADATNLQQGVKKTEETLGGLNASTEDTKTIISLLTNIVELLNQQLEEMHGKVYKVSSVLTSAAHAAGSAASAFQVFTNSSLIMNGALATAATGIGFFGKTILKSVAFRVLALVGPLGTLTSALYSAGAGAAAATPALIYLEDFVERLGIEATKLGTSLQFLQTLELGASRTGESVDSLRVAFTALLRNIEAARDGSENVTRSFEKLGVSTQDIENLSPEEIFNKVAVGLGKIEDPATRSAAALVVLGENGARLQPALRSIAVAEADLQRFGAVLDGLDIARLNDMGDGFDKLQTATSGFGRQLILPFAGLVEGVTKAFADVIGGATSVLSSLGAVLTPFLDLLGGVVQVIGSVIGVGLKLIGSVLKPLAYLFELVAGAVQFLTDGLDTLFASVNAGIDGWLQYFNLPEEWFGNAAAGAAEVAESLEAATSAAQDFYDEITSAVDAAAEFGQAGFDAALKYQEALEEINLLKEEGEYTEEQAAEAAKRANEAFRERIDLLQQAADEAAAAAKQEEEYQNKLAAMQAEMVRNEIKAREDAAKKAQADEEAYQQKLADLQAEMVRNQIQREEEIASKREELSKVSADMEQERLDALAANTNKALEASDIRSGGIASVIAMATGREDPAVQEARKQVRKLDEIRNEIRNLGSTVEIAGAA